MMQVQDLRIGNYVSDNFASDSFFAQVKKLDFTRCHYGNFHSCYSDLKPIPITEEWLLKFGFVFDDIAEYFTEEKVYIKYYNEFGIKIDIEGRFYNGIYQQKLQYVHQLQNLYFALTQKELILNE